MTEMFVNKSAKPVPFPGDGHRIGKLHPPAGGKLDKGKRIDLHRQRPAGEERDELRRQQVRIRTGDDELDTLLLVLRLDENLPLDEEMYLVEDTVDCSLRRSQLEVVLIGPPQMSAAP